MPLTVKTVYVYGQPMLVEFAGNIFQRKLGDNQVILGEKTEHDGMATKIVETELSDEDVLRFLNENAFMDLLRGAKQLVKPLYQKAVAGVKDRLTNVQSLGATMREKANVIASTDKAVEALNSASSSMVNFMKNLQGIVNTTDSDTIRNEAEKVYKELQAYLKNGGKVLKQAADQWIVLGGIHQPPPPKPETAPAS
jgi:hypothetical protein